MLKTHIRDLRLRNNAGIDIPVCKANARLLNTSSRYEFTTIDKPTCKLCLRLYPKRYPWAVRKDGRS